MNCLAIGDLMLPAEHFDSALKDSPLFGRYHSIQWNPVGKRQEMRDVIRKIETSGSMAFPMPDAARVLLGDAEVLFIHLCPVSAESIRSAPRLKYIATARGGVENIDVKAAKDREITIINCPAHNAVAVAEYVIGLMICEMRNIARSSLGLRRGEWIESYPNSDAIPELRTCAAGIVGFGTIGRLVAERLRAFETRILVFDPYVCAAEISGAGCEAASLDELLAASDIVTLHGRIPPEAPPLIGARELAIMKPTAYLINTARASLVDMNAAYVALSEGRIRGAAFDVFPSEPLPLDYPMLSLDNVTLTSHRAGDTLNSYTLAPKLLLGMLTDSLAGRGRTGCSAPSSGIARSAKARGTLPSH